MSAEQAPIRRGRFAIGIPTYNGAAYLPELAERLRRALECAAKHQLTIERLYVSDDSSSDGTPRLAEQMRSMHPDLNLTANPGPRGESANTNHLFRLARADGVEWMFVLHQDDVPAETWLTETVHALSVEPPGVVVAAPRADVSFESSDRTVGWTGIRRHFRGLESYRRATTEWFWKLSGSCIHVESYLASGGMDEELRYSADVDLMARMILESGDVLEIGRTLVIKRVHEASQSILGLRLASTVRAMLALYDRYSYNDDRRTRLRMLAAISWSALRNAILHFGRRDLRESGRNALATCAALARIPAALRKA